MFVVSLCVFLLNNPVQAQTYCTPTLTYAGTYCCNMGIYNVTIGTSINNTTTVATAQYYFDYTYLSACVAASQTVNVSFTAGQPPQSYAQYSAVWVDWDNDGTFDDSPGSPEIIYGDNYTADFGTVNFSFTVPSGVSPGNHRIRFASGYTGFGMDVDPCNVPGYADVEDYNLFVPSTGVDVGAVAVTSPSNWVVGNNNLTFTYKNFAGNTITSVDLGASLNGTTVGTTSLTGQNLTSCNGASQNYTVSLATAGFHILKVWARRPNGTYPDGNTGNDTLTISICTALSGTYTINPAGSGGSNFPTFTAAVNGLKNCGIGGPVTFNVAAGTYAEQISITPISGSSATNIVTFDGGSAATTILEYNASTANMHTVKLDGASNIRFRNLTIQTKSGTYGWAVLIKSNTKNAHFKKNIIQNAGGGVGTTTTNIQPIVISNADNNYSTAVSQVSNIEIDSNVITGGYFNFTLWGNQSGDVFNIMLRNNIFSDAYYYSIYCYYSTNMHVKNNIVRLRPGLTGGYGIMMNYFNGNATYANDVSGNEVYNTAQYAIQLNNVTNSSTNRGKMINNTVGGGFKNPNNNYGIYLYNSSTNWDIWHNTVNMDMSTTGTPSAALMIENSTGMDIRNNTLAVTAAGSTLPLYSNAAGQITKLDYNNYYKVGSDNSTVLVNIGPTTITKGSLKGALGFNQNSTSEFPLFISNTNLRLNNLGLSPFGDPTVGITTDIDNKTRCQLFPSMGASESPYVVSALAGILSADTVFINSPVVFMNAAGAAEPKTHVWTIENAPSTFSTLNVNYTFTALGAYKVKLKTVSCSGSDSITKIIVVVSPKVPPVSNFIADVNNVDQGSPVQLSDFSTGGPTSWTWTANPSSGVQFLPNASVQNPQVIFSNIGNYEICLKASNSAGAGNIMCKSAYIIVTEANTMCGTKVITKTATGKIYDSGGKAADYGNNQNCAFLLDPCASSVSLSFISFSLATGDVLRAYDGKDASSTPLHTGSGFTGTTLPADIIAKSGKMYLVMITNSSGTAAGFEAKWVSTAKAFNRPSAAFRVPDTLYTGTSFTFVSNSTGVDPSLAWDFNNDGFTDATTTTPSYTFATAGTHIVRLNVADCGGTDGAAKSIIVIAPTTAPVANFISDFGIVSPGQTVSFYDRSTQAPTSWTWTISPVTFTYVNGTNANSQNPKVQFNAIGNYDITLQATNSFGQGSVTKTGFIRVVNYCFPGADLNTDIGITRVLFAGIDNSSKVGPVTYSDYSQSVQAATVQKGAKYAITLERTTTLESMSRKVWIDFDGNGTFSNSELVASEGSSKTLSWTDSITIPATQAEGSVRMRIGTSYGISNNSPCGVNPFGEFEDYTVTVYTNLVKPIITLIGPATVTLEMGSPYTDQGATAMDDIQGNITSKIITSNNVNLNLSGTYYYRYNVSDNDGNSSAEVVRTIIVTGDLTPPVLTLLGPNPMNIPTGSSFVDSGATAFDTFDGNITSRIVVTGSVNPNAIGTYTLTYTVSDLAGHTVVKTRVVNVGDIEAPVIVLKGADTVYVNVFNVYNDLGAFVFDNFDKNLNYTVDLSGVNVSVLGTYVITYNAEDQTGNIAIPVNRVVIVRDITPPVLTLIREQMEVEVYSPFVDPGFTAIDNYYSNVTVTSTGSVNTSILGTYILFYTAVDGSGNVSAQKTRIVKVVDTQKPVITMNGEIVMNVCRWATYTEPGASVTDNYDTNPVLFVSGNVNTLVEGLTVITYTSRDNSGNQEEKQRFVNVITCNAANGIEENLKTDITLYPNPTGGLLNISVNRTNLTEFNIVVKDLLGRTVNASISKNAVEGTAVIDMENEASGMYFVSLIVNNESMIRKIKVVK